MRSIQSLEGSTKVTDALKSYGGKGFSSFYEVYAKNEFKAPYCTVKDTTGYDLGLCKNSKHMAPECIVFCDAGWEGVARAHCPTDGGSMEFIGCEKIDTCGDANGDGKPFSKCEKGKAYDRSKHSVPCNGKCTSDLCCSLNTCGSANGPNKPMTNAQCGGGGWTYNGAKKDSVCPPGGCDRTTCCKDPKAKGSRYCGQDYFQGSRRNTEISGGGSDVKHFNVSGGESKESCAKKIWAKVGSECHWSGIFSYRENENPPGRECRCIAPGSSWQVPDGTSATGGNVKWNPHGAMRSFRLKMDC